MIKRFKPGLKKCKTCPVYFEKSIYKPLQEVCGPFCAIKLVRSRTEAKEKKEWKKVKKVWKDKLKTLGQHEQEARKVFQKFIRLRDNDLACISCGSVHSKQWDASHYYEAGVYSALIFDETNVHKACVTCNRWHSGNLLNYRNGLIERFGIGYVELLEEKAKSGKDYKYSKDELIGIKQKYEQKIKQFGC